MKKVKSFLKKLLPKAIISLFLPAYHWLRALTANLIFGFPAKKMKVIGITGTNGKTTTAAFLASALQECGYKVGVSSTAFYQIGDKRTINDKNMTVTNPFAVQWLLRKMRFKKVDWVILEVTSHALVQNRVWGIPFVAVGITNLTQDHLDYHKNMQAYAEAKALIFKNTPEVIALNADDEWYEFFDKHEARREKLSYGTSEDADIQIKQAKLTPSGSKFKILADKSNEHELSTLLQGKFNVYNSLLAFTLCYALRFDLDDVKKGIAKVESVPGRMQALDFGQRFDVIIDYAHTADALKNVLETLKELTKNRVIIVFGATGERDKKKRPIMGEVVGGLADRIYVTEDEPYSEDPARIRKDVMAGIKKAKALSKTDEVAGRREAIKKALNVARAGDTVLITGMGHQEFMTVAEGKIPWNDANVTEELLKELKKI